MNRESKEMKALAMMLGAVVIIGLLTVIGTIANGYAMSVLWGWFVVPTFGAPDLGIAPAIGIALIVNYLTSLTHRTDDYSMKDNDLTRNGKIARIVILVLGKPVMYLLFGGVVRLFMK